MGDGERVRMKGNKRGDEGDGIQVDLMGTAITLLIPFSSFVSFHLC